MKLADRILALVLDPGDASVLVGDLLEEKAQRGSFWFWSHVLRSLISAGGKEIMREPLKMVGLGVQSIRVMTFSFLAGLAATLAVVVVLTPLRVGGPWAFLASLLLMVGLPSLAAGIVSARRAPGREFAAGVVANAAASIGFAVLVAAICAVLFLLGHVLGAPYGNTTTPSSNGPFIATMGLTNFALFAVGAMAVRIFRLARKKTGQPRPPSPVS